MNVPAAIEPEPVVLYTFTERAGASVYDRMPGKNHLTIPPAFKALKRHVVLQFWRDMRWDVEAADDVLINIAGFVPFALCVLAVFAGSGRMSSGRAAFMTVLAGAALSFIVETGQLALPTRTPSLLDFLCNTVGAALVVLVFTIVACLRTTR